MGMLNTNKSTYPKTKTQPLYDKFRSNERNKTRYTNKNITESLVKLHHPDGERRMEEQTQPNIESLIRD